jgi:hypothetical protein
MDGFWFFTYLIDLLPSIDLPTTGKFQNVAKFRTFKRKKKSKKIQSLHINTDIHYFNHVGSMHENNKKNMIFVFLPICKIKNRINNQQFFQFFLIYYSLQERKKERKRD